jgi:putative Mn2+ efflux pump MntP
MEILYLFFIAIINSIDNMGIGIAYSIAKVRVPIFRNLVISLMAFTVAFLSALSGDILSHVLTEELAKIISMFLLISIGIRIIYDALKKDTDESLEKVKIIGGKEAISVGTILALDDVGSSVSSGLAGYGPFAVAAPFFIVSFIIFLLANYGSSFMHRLSIGIKANIVAGIIMVTIGILRYFN